MLRGDGNAKALKAIDGLPFEAKGTGLVSGDVDGDTYFIELRDGRVDPAFNLDGVYLLHRKVVLGFLYAALAGNQRMLRHLTTDASKVKVDGPKAAGGDMDVYASVIEMMPVVRSSKPSEDARSRTVTYRVPLGETVLSLALVKEGSLWKIDTSKSVRVPLEWFYR